MLQEGYPSECISRVQATHIIKEVFPHNQSTQDKKWKQNLWSSVAETSASTSQPKVEVSPQITSDLEQALESEWQKNTQLTARIQVSEAIEQQQSQQLKAQSESSHLKQQVGEVARRTTNQVFHGPDTVEHFKAISIDSVIREKQASRLGGTHP